VHSPARVSRRIGRPWHVPTPPLRGVFAGSAFWAVHVYYRPVSSSFHPPPGVLFSFPSRYCCAIGLGGYLALEASGSPLPAPYPRCGTLGHRASSLRPSPTGLSPSLAGHSRPLRLGLRDGPRAPLTPHPHMVAHAGSVWAVPRSVALTRGIPFWFLFLPLLGCFRSGGSHSQVKTRERHRFEPVPGYPIRVSPDLRLLAATRGLSQLAAPFVGPRAELSTGRRILAEERLGLFGWRCAFLRCGH